MPRQDYTHFLGWGWCIQKIHNSEVQDPMRQRWKGSAVCFSLQYLDQRRKMIQEDQHCSSVLQLSVQLNSFQCQRGQTTRISWLISCHWLIESRSRCLREMYWKYRKSLKIWVVHCRDHPHGEDMRDTTCVSRNLKGWLWVRLNEKMNTKCTWSLRTLSVHMTIPYPNMLKPPQVLLVNTSQTQRSWGQRLRRLKDEYESAVFHLSELVQFIFCVCWTLHSPLFQIDNNLSTPLHIASVHIDGTPNTRRSFLSSLIRPQLPSAHPTLESVLHTTRQITQSLHKSDIFQSVEAKIEKSQDALARDGDIDIIFKTCEKGRFFLNTSTEVGNGKGNTVCFLPFLHMIFHSF